MKNKQQQTNQLENTLTEIFKYEVEAMEAAIEGNLEDDCQIITKDTMRILTSIKTQWGMKYPFE